MSTSAAATPRFWKPGTIAPGSLIERDESDTLLTSAPPSASSFSGASSSHSRLLLPIAGHRSQLLYALETHQVLIMIGATGSGKSSQLPQYLHDAGWTSHGKMIGITQPRRIACVNIATHVAQERGSKVGEDEVGYAFRFEDCTSEETKMKFMTDGLLLRETRSDPLLSAYSVIILDEAHERSVATDILMALLRKILQVRSDLRLVVSSATMEAERFQEYFESALIKTTTTNTAAASSSSNDDASSTSSTCILSVSGRSYPIDIFYTSSPVRDYLRASVDTIMHIARSQPAGDVLCFLCGREEIESVQKMVEEEIQRDGTSFRNTQGGILTVLPFYAGLPTERQLSVFAPTPGGHRKVVLATNVAEASITIDGLRYVIDCGFVKTRVLSTATCENQLELIPISQASAQQRSGRAGRTGKGVTYRLYTEEYYTYHMQAQSLPEICRTDLTDTLLQLKCLNIAQPLTLKFMDPLPLKHVTHALQSLYTLGACTQEGDLTQIGRMMGELPLETKLARVLLASCGVGGISTTGATSSSSTSSTSTDHLCSEEFLSLVSLLSVPSIFLSSQQRGRSTSFHSTFAVHEGDHITLLNAYNLFEKQRKANPDKVAAWCHRSYLNFKSLVRVVTIRKQLRSYLKKKGLPIVSNLDSELIRKILLTGYYENIAVKQEDGSYRMMQREGKEKIRKSSSSSSSSSAITSYHIHPTSVLHSTLHTAGQPHYLLFHESLETTKHFIRDCSVIEPGWLLECMPQYFKQKTGLEEEVRRYERLMKASESNTGMTTTDESGAEIIDGVRGEPGRKHRKLF